MLPNDSVGVGAEDPSVHAAAARALDLIADGARIGLGSGAAASVFIAKLGARRREGLKVSCVPTSRASADQAHEVGLPLIALGERLDLTVDGADEVAPNLDRVKGWGGAMVRERIVAAASKQQVILVNPKKLVAALGERRRVPVEVIPFARWLAMKELEALGLVPTLRMNRAGGQPFVTENGNLTIDCDPRDPIGDEQAARELERHLLSIAGVVDTGLFLGTAHQVFVGHSDGRVDTLVRIERPRPNESS
jgi:ribose 5-phosphate isomerase A